MDALFVISGGDGNSGDTGEEVKDGLNANFAAIVAEFRNTRTVTGINAITQDDDNALIIFNSGTDFDFTLDQLTANSKASFVNIGAGDVTFTNGSGVTVSGNVTLAGASGTSYPTAIVFYHTATTPRVIQGGSGGGGGTGDVVGPASSTDGTVALFNGITGKLLKTGIVSVANGGTGTDSPGLIAGTNITSITGTWPNQTINAATQGGGSSGPWDDTTAGTVERSTTAEMQAVINAFLALSSSGLSASRTGSEIGLYDLLGALGVYPKSQLVTASGGGGASGTVAINLDNIRWAKYTTGATWTGNITINLTNAGSSDEFEMMELIFLVTGTIRITFDSNVRMPDGTAGWNYAGKYIDVVSGGTGVLYRMTFTKAGSTIAVGMSTAITI